jgi:ATP-dependent helicase/DNAse subunit B
MVSLPDPYSAVWVSHTSINDFLQCPRGYYLKNIYKHPKTGHKVKIMSPPLALGQAVHEVIEALSTLPTQERFKSSLLDKFNLSWTKVTGKKGGFFQSQTETYYKDRGLKMIKTVMEHPGPLLNLAVKIQQDLPHFWLSEEDQIILCGKIDWLEYLPDIDSVHIIDFKTSQKDESPTSLQLPIYHLLVHHCQSRKVVKASYWYIDRQIDLTPKELPDLDTARTDILKLAKEIKLARKLNRFKCPHQTGCNSCLPYEAILRDEAEFVGENEYHQDIFILPMKSQVPESIVL